MFFRGRFVRAVRIVLVNATIVHKKQTTSQGDKP